MNKIKKLSNKGGLIGEFTMQHLVIEGFNEEAILRCCKGEAKTHKRHQFRFVEEKKQGQVVITSKPSPDNFVDEAAAKMLENKEENFKTIKIEEPLDESEWDKEELEELVQNYIPFIVDDSTFIKTSEAAEYLEDSMNKKIGPIKLNLFMRHLLLRFKEYVEVNK